MTRSMRLKYLADVNLRALPESTAGDTAFAYIDIGSVRDGAVVLPDTDVTFSEAPSRARRQAPAGATIVSTVRTYLRAIARVPAVEDRPLVFSTGFAVLEARQGLDPGYLFYACRSDRVVDEIVSRSVGVSYPAINPSALMDVRIFLPPITEQERIASFLDAQVRLLDDAILLREEQLTLLRQRQAAALRAILNGGETGRTMRPQKLKYLARIQRGASPRPIDDPAYFDDNGTHAWVRIADVTASGKYLTTTTQRLSELGLSLSVPIEPEELFVSVAGSVGKPVIAGVHCCIHDGFVAIREPKIERDLIYYTLLLGDCFAGLGNLGTQLNLNSDIIRNLVIQVPPDEHHQRDMVTAAEELVDAHQRLQKDLRTSLALLAERKTALITAAVDGQFDITAARSVA